MPTLVAQPTRIRAAGTKPKLIDEFIGRVNTKTSGVSVAHMRSPQGWEEPGQTPEFDEFTIVLKGHPAREAQERRTGRRGRPGSHRPQRRMDPIFHSRRRRRRIHRGMPASIRDGNRPPRRLSFDIPERCSKSVILSAACTSQREVHAESKDP